MAEITPEQRAERAVMLGMESADTCGTYEQFLAASRLAVAQAIREAEAPAYERGQRGAGRQFQLGERVTKIKGSSWTGRVVGFYSTSLTPEGYAIESETERGSVQIYPAAAIRALPTDRGE